MRVTFSSESAAAATAGGCLLPDTQILQNSHSAVLETLMLLSLLVTRLFCTTSQPYGTSDVVLVLPVAV